MVNLYKYPFELRFRFSYDGALKTGVDLGDYTLIVLVNAIERRGINKRHRIVKVAKNIIANMTTVHKKITYQEARNILHNVYIHPMESFYEDELAKVIAAITKEEEKQQKAIAQFKVNHMARRIQRAWFDAYYNPSHPVCKKRLLRQYTEIA